MYKANLKAFTGIDEIIESDFRTVCNILRSLARATSQNLMEAGACIYDHTGHNVAYVGIYHGAQILEYNDRAVVERWLS